MRDGKQVSVATMTTLHIQNCVKMLQNNLRQREIYRPMIQELQGLLTLLEKTAPPKASERSTQILDQADTDLMIAETLLDEQQDHTRTWIQVFEQELVKRETN
jgi:hypothetical protein